MSLKYSTLLSKNGDTYLEVTCSKYKLLIVLQLWIILHRTQCCKYIYEPQTTKKYEPMVLHASWIILKNNFFYFFYFFSVRHLSVLRGHSVFPPHHNGQWPPTSKDFYSRSYPLHYFSYLNSWERASIFPFQCSVLNKGTTGNIFITSLVWRGPWLGIEPGPPALKASTLALGYRGGGTKWGIWYLLTKGGLGCSILPSNGRLIPVPWAGISLTMAPSSSSFANQRLHSNTYFSPEVTFSMLICK